MLAVTLPLVGLAPVAVALLIAIVLAVIVVGVA